MNHIVYLLAQCKIRSSTAIAIFGLFLYVTPAMLLPAQASIFACSTGAGTVFQDKPCEYEKSRIANPEPTARFPLSIHASWFAIPVQAEDRAYCDRRSCVCGNITKNYQNSQAQAVADALYLDGSWHRYETLSAAWLATPSSQTQKLVDLKRNMFDASCEIMIAQQILKDHAKNVMAELVKTGQEASDRGFDIEAPCLQKVPDACSFYKSVQLLAQLRRDATSLKHKRGVSMLDIELSQSD